MGQLVVAVLSDCKICNEGLQLETQNLCVSDRHLQVSFQCESLEGNFTMVTQVVLLHVLSVALCLLCGAQVKNTQISLVSDEFAN